MYTRGVWLATMHLATAIKLLNIHGLRRMQMGYRLILEGLPCTILKSRPKTHIFNLPTPVNKYATMGIPAKTSNRSHRSRKNPIAAKQASRKDGTKSSPPLAGTPARHLAVAVFLTILVTAGYTNVLQNGFVWDDTIQILQNPFLRPGASWLRLFNFGVWAFPNPGRPSANNYYRPLQMLTYKIIVQMFGFSAPAFHSVSLIFHLIVTLLVYIIILQLTRRFALATAAAALFALHPIHTEAVAWVSALPELGCAIFFLLAFLLFLLAIRPTAKGPVEQPARLFRRTRLWFLSCASFALALLWKEMAVTMPLVIASHLILFSPEELPAAARIRRAFRGSLPYWAVLGAYLPLRYHALGFFSVSQRNWALPPRDYALTVVDLVAKYWWKLLLPLHLNAYHIFDPVRSLAEPRALGAILFVGLAVAGVAYGYRRFPLATFAASWVFLTLIPVLDLRDVGRNVFAERYLYIPSVGFCLLLVWLASEALATLPMGWRSQQGVCALTLVGAMYFAQTAKRNMDWRDQFTFFSRTLEASPNSPGIENGVADLLRSEKSDPEGAESHYRRALALAKEQHPPEWDQVDSADQGLALIYSERGAYDKALDLLAEAQAAEPNDPEVQSARGAVLLQAGHWKEAQSTLRAALQADPNDANALNGLGFIAWQDEHQYDQAVDYFQHALQMHPPSDAFNASLHASLGAVYCEMGRYPEGIAHLQSAIELSPNDPEYHTNLAYAFTSLGRLAEAHVELEKALTLAPGYAPARTALSDLEKQHR